MTTSFSIHQHGSNIYVLLGDRAIARKHLVTHSKATQLHNQLSSHLRNGQVLNPEHWELSSQNLVRLNQAEFNRVRRLFGTLH